ncbi:hypothetical protein [Rubripirellula reticaptiva]|uniref:Uncharacterized protein n=1 Tax=Rubripirellula reticaptiva TaxID=2528013 RepID=A0A5C6F5Q6_9BACT|nr:hypothetical protein [Rubripirellula reticaptiva]TWU55757.1 hypothetical protein Poly59_20580 [Rubripirellula reticaptiva]
MGLWMSMASLLLIGITPGSDADSSASVQQTVDLIELNHFVDDEGREVFRQLVFYDWSKTHRRFHVRAWRLVKHDNQLPTRHWSPDRHQCRWYDGGLLRQVSAPHMRETWTQQDPERVNRKLLPEDERVPLFEPRITAKPE